LIGIAISFDLSSEVLDRENFVIGLEQASKELVEVEPLERGALHRSVVEIEPVDISVRANFNSPHNKAETANGGLAPYRRSGREGILK